MPTGRRTSFLLHRCLLLLLLLWIHYEPEAQTSNLFWLTGETRYVFSNNLNARSIIDYRAEWGEDHNLKSLFLRQDFMYSLNPTLEVSGHLRVFFTDQNDTLNSTELRPTLATKFNVLQLGRVTFDNLVRFEWRLFYYNYSELNSSSQRLRNRLRAFVPINRRRYFLAKSVTFLASVEPFITPSRGEPEERFANRWRYEAGMEYRFSDTQRLRFSYFNQRSRSDRSSDFNSTEHLFRLRFVYIFLKKKEETSRSEND